MCVVYQELGERLGAGETFSSLGWTTPVRRNAARDLDYVEYKRILNRFFRHSRFGKHLKMAFDNGSVGPGLFFSKSYYDFPKEGSETRRRFLTIDDARAILAYYETTNSTIARKYFNRERLFLEELEGDFEPYGGLSNEKIVEVTGFYLLSILDETAKKSYPGKAVRALANRSRKLRPRQR